MGTALKLGDITVDVEFKPIKNVHLSVYPPAGKVRIAAPQRMTMDTVRLFAIAKLGWIKAQQQKLQSQPRETPREYLDRESHYVWGKRYLLRVMEQDAVPKVELKHTRLVLRTRPGTGPARRREILDAWYRERLTLAVPPLIEKMDASPGCFSESLFCAADENQMGQLQCDCGLHPAQYRAGQKTARMSRIYRRA